MDNKNSFISYTSCKYLQYLILKIKWFILFLKKLKRGTSTVRIGIYYTIYFQSAKYQPLIRNLFRGSLISRQVEIHINSCPTGPSLQTVPPLRKGSGINNRRLRVSQKVKWRWSLSNSSTVLPLTPFKRRYCVVFGDNVGVLKNPLDISL